MGEETTDNPAHLLSDSPQLCDQEGYVSSYLLDIVKESRLGVGVGGGGYGHHEYGNQRTDLQRFTSRANDNVKKTVPGDYFTFIFHSGN